MLLPRDVVQPFDLRLVRDDLHVMAFFAGHPSYEAVEAMIRRKADGGAVIRCILTRHDQSQVDCVNDTALLDTARSTQRETCFREIALREEATTTGPRARLELESHEGERAVLDVVAAGQPDARFGGLTDPGSHSPESVLPLMWRGKSTLAGPATRVRFGETDFPATRGYYTEQHSLGVLRAGTVELRLLARPEPIAPGGKWLYEREGKPIAYRVTERSAAQGALRIEREGGTPEWILARVSGDRLDATEIGVGPGLVLAFSPDGRFAMRIESSGAAVTGTHSADASSLCLIPDHPVWARARALTVECSRARDMLTLTSKIAPRRGGE